MSGLTTPQSAKGQKIPNERKNIYVANMWLDLYISELSFVSSSDCSNSSLANLAYRPLTFLKLLSPFKSSNVSGNVRLSVSSKSKLSSPEDKLNIPNIVNWSDVSTESWKRKTTYNFFLYIDTGNFKIKWYCSLLNWWKGQLFRPLLQTMNKVPIHYF